MSKTKTKAQIAAEAAWCFEQKLMGHTLGVISLASREQFGTQLAVTTIWRRIEDEISARVTPRVDQYRQMEEARYDRYLAALEPKIAAGDPVAIDKALRIADRRARLLGLDAPVKIGVDATVRYVIEGVDTADLT